MTHKELTAMFRRQIKEAGIKARVQMDKPLKGWPGAIMVNTPTYEASFTPEEAVTIANIAIDNGFTNVRGMPIDKEIVAMTGSKKQYFECPQTRG